jgi:hypothetical protein
MNRTLAIAAMITALMCAPSAFAGEPNVAGIIAEGLTAAAQKDAKGLLKAANTLDRLGAHPGEGTADLVAMWRTDAARLGESAEQIPYRGRTLGPAYRQYQIASGANLSTRQSFNAGQKAEISLVSISGARIELKVRDEDGSVVCALAITSRNGACVWTPGWTAPYAIDVTNPTGQAAPIYLITN